MTNAITAEFTRATADGFVCSFDPDTGAARFESARVVLIKREHGGEWEYYKVLSRGKSAGLQMFQRYLPASERHAVELALAYEMGRQVAPVLPSTIAGVVAQLG